MWLVIAIPPHQSGVAHVFKKKLEFRRFNMSVAEHHVRFSLVA
jgi:hypothetical protein